MDFLSKKEKRNKKEGREISLEVLEKRLLNYIGNLKRIELSINWLKVGRVEEELEVHLQS